MTATPGITGELVLPAAAYRRDRRPWLEARRTGLGASETATILGLNDWHTPYSVWLSKVTPSGEGYASEAAEWGSALEAVIARKVSTRHPELGKIAPTPGLLRHPDHPWMLATLDRLLVPRGVRNPEPTALLEVKTVSDFMYRARWIDGVPPPHVLVQTQQQLAVAGIARAYIAVLIGGQKMPEPYPVDRDERVIEQLVTYGGTWWKEFVEAHRPPELTFADRAALALRYPGNVDLGPLVADDDMLATFSRFMDARRREAEAKAEKEAAAFLIQKAMGDRTRLVDADDRLLATWSPTLTNKLDTPALNKAHPHIAAEFTTKVPGRRFLPRDPDA